MKKLICILLAAATAAGCEKDDPTRYDMSQGRVCFPGAAPNETAEYPGYSNSDSTFYASMTFKQQPEGVAEAVIEVPVKLIGGASGSDRKIGVRVLEEGTTARQTWSLPSADCWPAASWQTGSPPTRGAPSWYSVNALPSAV